MKILLIDDYDVILRVLSTYLRTIGCQVVTADSAEAGIREYMSDPNSFDVVLTDLVLETERGGLDVLRAVRDTGAHTKLILMSAHLITGNIAEEATGYLVKAFLHKPFGLDDLKRALGLESRS